MHIGLVGGIGPAATDFYYRRLIRECADRGVDLELTIAHADAPTLLTNLSAHNVDGQVATFSRLIQRLEAAGAQCVAVTAIGGHFCIDPLKRVASLPVIDMIEEVARHVAERGLTKVGILGTRTVMETRFYGGITTATVVPPDGPMMQQVHDAYATMAAAGHVTAAQRAVFEQASHTLIEREGVEAIMLGGTDLALVYNGQTSPIPLVDCAAIHVDAIVEKAAA